MKIDITKLNCENCKHYKVCKYKEEIRILKEKLKRLDTLDALDHITIYYECDYYGIEIDELFTPPYTVPCSPTKFEPTWIGDDPSYDYKYQITCESNSSKQDPNVKITAINGETDTKDNAPQEWELWDLMS